MKADVIRIGNSRGIRIPKELEVRPGQLVVKRAERPRSGWEDAFTDMAQRGDDMLLDPDSGPSTRWDETEWRW
jgi:antitoxin MazE